MKKSLLLLAIILFVIPSLLEAQADTSLFKLLETTKIEGEMLLDTLVFHSSPIYPNPCDDICNIDITINKQENVKLRVLNLLGSTVYDADRILDQGVHKIELDLSALEGGVYFYTVEVIGKKYTIVTKKLIVK